MRPRPEGRGEQSNVEVVNGEREASMRPRPEGRGEPNGVSIGQIASGFNAATTRRPWRTWTARIEAATWARLQCGHDPKAVENDRGQSGDGDHGTRFNAATTRRPWRTSRPYYAKKGLGMALQCGHDPKAVENHGASLAIRPASARFNAATTRRPWRTVCLEPGRTGDCRFNAATTRRPWRTSSLPARWGSLLASMRPRPEGRGELSGGRDAGTAVVCFNAATTRRPWRTVSVQTSPPPADRASMRPRPEGRGERNGVKVEPATT